MTVVEEITLLNKSMYSYCSFKTSFEHKKIEDFIQNTWMKCYTRIHEDKELVKEFIAKKGYFKNYVFRALKNALKNEYIKLGLRPIKSELDYYEDNMKGRGRPIDGNDDNEEFDDTVEVSQKQNAVKKFITSLQNTLSNDESEFLDIAIEKSSKGEKINISEIGRIVTGSALKGHDILKRIQRKAKRLERKEKILKYVSAPGKKSALQLFDIFSESIEPDMYDESNRIARDITNNVLKKLGPDALGILAKFF